MKKEVNAIIIALLIVVMLLSVMNVAATVGIGREVDQVKENVAALAKIERERYEALDQRIAKLEEAVNK